MLPYLMFSSQSNRFLYPSTRLSLFRSSSPRPCSAVASAPQLSTCPYTPGPVLSSAHRHHSRPFAASSCSLTEQKESKKRPLFPYAYEGKNLQLLYCYIFTEIGGGVFFELPFSPESASLPRYIFTSLLWSSSHGTNVPLGRLHRCRGELHA